MDLIAINNRCLFNYGKVKRAEMSNRKKTEAEILFLPDLKKLKLDNRTVSHKEHVELSQTENNLLTNYPSN